LSCIQTFHGSTFLGLCVFEEDSHSPHEDVQ
jgi:hypothetical protein